MSDGARSNSTDDKLRLFIERIENMNEEIAGLTADRADIFAEAKGEGYDTKIMREVIKRRKMSPDDLRNFEDVLELYKLAVGLG